MRDYIGIVRYGFFLSRRFRWREHDIESATGVFPFGENMCVNPWLGRCFFRRVIEGWIGVWRWRVEDRKVWRLKIEVFGLRIER